MSPVEIRASGSRDTDGGNLTAQPTAANDRPQHLRGSFDYRIVARCLDDVGRRLERVEIPLMAPLDVDQLTRPSEAPRRER